MGHLRPATAAEKQLRDRATFAAWGRGSSLEEYLAREEGLRQLAWPRKVMTTWLYIAEDQRTVLASCETYQVESWVGHAPGKTWAVASVFTEEALRGNGYASALLGALLQHLRQLPTAQASVLFSDVGEEIYRRVGYTFVASQQDWLFTPTPWRQAPSALRWLSSPPHLSKASHPHSLCLVPTAEQLAWHMALEQLAIASVPNASLTSYGVELPGPDGGTAFWLRDPKAPDELAIYWLGGSSPQAQHQLIAAARHTAHLSGLSGVSLWDGPPLELRIGEGVQRKPRKGMIPMMAPLDASIEAWAPIQRGLWV